MKRRMVIVAIVLLWLSLAGCKGVSVSTETYDEIAAHVLDEIEVFSPEKAVEFFNYDSTGLSVGGIYYGYYYSADNEIVIPDFYSGGNLGERYETDGGTYFGKPNNGTDWCFIKQITDKWYYYELHWA